MTDGGGTMETGFSGIIKGLCRSLALSAAVIALVSPATTVFAAPHAAIVIPCERCHTLDDQSNEPLTTYLSNAAPNFSIMLGMTGGGVPNVLGCYLCHTQTDRYSTSPDPLKRVMKDVSGDFGSKTSMHAVGRLISTGADTENEVQSNWTGNALVGWTGGTNVPDELQCAWCHNVAANAYPDHYPGLQASDPANPNLLYNVIAAADMNNLCFGRCHVGTSFPNGGQTVTVPAMGHVGWARFSDGGTPTDKADDTMVTGRGTAIKTADCTLCHNTHSSNKAAMIRDGISEGGTAIDENNCTAVCHNTPAQWLTKGHGQFGTFDNTSCGPCHSTAVKHRYYDPGPPAVSNPLRFGFPEDTSPSSIAYNGAGDGLDNDFDGMADNAGEATWAFKQESMCRGCHQKYMAHGGDVYKDGGSGGTSGMSSCLDCHDPHGAGVAPANIKMIRGDIGATAGGKTQEPTVFTATTDFYNGAGTGVCDNANCHGPTFTEILNNPASGSYTVHTAAGVTIGTNCVLCHRHDSVSGGFAANCNDCHNYPPTSGAHLKHKDLGYNCWDCHFGNNHNPTMIAATPATFDALYSRNQIELAFNPAGFNSDANNGSLAAPVATKGVGSRLNTTCSGLACHNPDNAVTGKVLPADETNNVPVWGNTYDACTDCHAKSVSGDPPNKSHNKHDSKYRCFTCHADVDVGPSGPGRATHANKTLNAGQVVFGGTIGADTIPAGTSTVPISGAPPAAFAAGVCSNTYCHGNFAGGTTTNAPDWLAKTGGTCGACHGASAAAPPQGHAHPQHTGNNQANSAERQYSYPCNYCHVTTTSDGSTITGAALHVDGYSEFAFDATVPMLAGASYGGDATVGNNTTDAADICSTLYCHGAGAPFPATMVGTDTTPEWNVATTAACGTCHVEQASDFTAGVGSEKHAIHAGDRASNNYAMSCQVCHYSVTTDGITIAATGPANHVNLQANVAFDGTDPRLNTNAGLPPVSVYNGTPDVGAGYGTCDNTFCHSRARDLVRPFTDPPYTAVSWGDAVTGSCSICHGGALSYGPSYPDGTLIDGTPKANKHQSHGYNALGFSCATCHGWWTSVVPGEFRAKHVNGVYEPTGGSYNALDDFTFTAGAVAGGINGTCSAVVCHGGNTVDWGQNMTAAPWSANDNHFTCDICHGMTAAAPAATDVNDFAIGVSTAGAVMSKVSAPEYAAYGHGASAGAVFPSNIQKACRDCHDSTVTHETVAANLSAPSPDSANPFRLRDQDVAVNLQFSCSYNNAACHPAATIGPATGKTLGSIITHSNEGMGPDTKRTWPATWDPRCTECHDPHGDGANLSMVQREIYDKGSTVQALSTGSEVWGVPVLPNDNNAVAFTNNTAGIAVGSYAEPAPNFSGVCQECHERAAAANGVTSFHDGPGGGSEVAGAHPTNPGDCSVCHTHDKAFKAPPCYGCHGSEATKQYWPDGAAGIPAYADDNAGAHENHVLAISQRLYGQNIAQLLADPATDARQKTICAFCHPNPGSSGHNVNNGAGNFAGTADVWFDGQNNAGGAGNNFQAYKVGAGAYGDDAGAAQATYDNAPAAKTCSNLDCHNEYVTPVGWNTPPDWSALIPDARCSNLSCHAGGSYSIAHAAHVNDKLAVAAGNGYLCTECHVDNGTNLRHQNGQVDMLFTAAGTVDVQFGGATPGYYDKDFTQAGGNAPGAPTAGDTGFAYKNGVYGRSCYNIYCHGADSAWGGADTSPVWNVPATATCYAASTCHNGYGSPYDAGGVARNGITTGSHQKHMIQWTSAAGVEAANPTGPRMSAHPNSLAGSTQHSCSACHNVSQGVCDDCHNGIVGSGASLPTLTHADGQVDFTGTITGPSPLTIVAESLATTNACDECHGGAAPAVTAKGNWASGTLLACESCHGDYAAARSRRNIGWPPETSVDAPLRAGAVFDSSGHGKVTDNVTYGGRACVNCHNEASQHFTQRTNTIAPALGDTNRLDVLGGNDYAVAPTAFCGTCHSGPVETVHYANTKTAGGSSDDGNQCAICHDPHGQSGQDGMFVASVPVGGTISGFADKALRASYANAAFQGVCQACHDGAAPDSVLHFNRTTNEIATHETAGGLCINCHRHTTTVAFSANCYDCHGDTAGGTHIYPDTADQVSFPDRAGRHAAHINRIVAVMGVGYSAADNSTCRWCHPGGVHSGDTAQPAELADGTTSHFRSINDTVDGGESVTQAGTDVTCTNVDCHYNNPPPAADWYGAPTVTCDYCHFGDVGTYAPGNPLPNAHTRHVDETADGGYNYTCTVCHPDYATSSNWAHQDGVVNGDVVFTGVPWGNGGTAETLSGGNGLVKYGGGVVGDYYTCNGISCHGDYPGGNRGDGGTALNAPIWFNTVAQVGGALADGRCGTCHGTVATLEPSPANTDGTPKANKHPKHHVDNGYGCQECHYAVTSDGATVADRSLHANGAINVVQATGATALKSFTWASPNCTVAACHGGVSVQWTDGTPDIACDVCHANAGGTKVGVVDVNNWSWDGTTQSKINDQAGGEYATRGHGKTLPAATACAGCHDSAVAHDLTMAGTNPFRLQGGAAFTCSNSAGSCHDGTPTASVATVVDHTRANMVTAGYAPQVAAWTFTPKCVDCHDPHGDGANLHMAHNDLWDNGSGTNFVPTDYVSIGNTNLLFTTDTLGVATGSYAWSTTTAPNYSGICQECHEINQATFESFRDNENPLGGTVAVSPHPAAPDPGDCGVCHKHSEAFKPSGCNGCHGTVGGNYYPDESAYPDRAGKHLPHVQRIAALNALNVNDESTCGWCHPNPGMIRTGTGELSHSDYVAPADLHGDGRAGAAVTHFSDIRGAADAGDTVTVNVSCNNVNCHYNTTVTIADWYGAPAVSCTYCHQGDGAYNAGVNPLPNAHTKHVDEVADGGYNYACTVCHPDYATSSNWAHQDGVVSSDVVFTGVPWGNGGNLAESVSGGTGAVKYGTGVAADYYTCNGISCHGDYNGGNNGVGGTALNAPSWFNTDLQDDATANGTGDG
ncbi:MAG: CxxxxCH/CxxCH domain c-type cytochrome, partial [Candidatus Methylomirabilia bacterium]